MVRTLLTAVLVVLAACSGPAPAFDLSGQEDVFAAAGVNTYREELVLRLHGPGAEAGELETDLRVVAHHQREPEAERLIVTSGGQAARSLETIRIEERGWARYAQDPWLEIDPSTGALASRVAPFAPEDLTRVADRMAFVATEERDGRTAHRFRADQEAMATLLGGEEGLAEGTSLEEATMDVWVDPDGFVLRLEATVTGTGFAGAPGRIPATMELTYRLYDLGATLSIEPPVGP